MRYAVIEDGVCVNIVKAEAGFAALMGWTELPSGAEIGWSYAAGVWSAPVFPEEGSEPGLGEDAGE